MYGCKMHDIIDWNTTKTCYSFIIKPNVEI